MRYSATEILRRGFDNMVANWPLLLIRLGEVFVFVIVIIAAAIAAIIPIVVSVAGTNWQSLVERNDAPQAVAQMMLSHLPLFLFLFVLVSVVMIVFLAVHSFVEGGSVRIYADGEFAARSVSAGPRPARAAFRAFGGERWLSGGKRDWWPIFLIYNIAWFFGGMIILLPFIVVSVLFIIGMMKPVAMVVGCLVAVVSFFFVLLVAILTGIWCNKAIVICVARTLSAVESLRVALADIRNDFMRHFVVAFVLMMISFGGALLISSFGIGMSFVRDPGAMFMLMPLRMAMQVASQILSLGVAAWMIASFTALTIDR